MLIHIRFAMCGKETLQSGRYSLIGKASYLILVNIQMKTPSSSPGTLPYNSIFIEYKILFGWIAKWSNAPDCKSGGSAFEGSNPSPSINSGVLSSDNQW